MRRQVTPRLAARGIGFPIALWVALLASSCATQAPDMAAEDAFFMEQLLTNAHRGAVDFEVARQRGDAEAMARAAVLRRAFDAIQVRLGDASQGIDMPTGEQMLAAAKTRAAEEPALLARVEAIARPPVSTGLWGVFADRVNSVGGTRPPPLSNELPLPRRPTFAAPTGRFIAVPARASVRLRTALVARQSLIVYAQSSGGAAMRMEVLDDGGASLCRDAQPHGNLICRWRATKAMPITVVLDNSADVPVRVLVSTNL